MVIQNSEAAPTFLQVSVDLNDNPTLPVPVPSVPEYDSLSQTLVLNILIPPKWCYTDRAHAAAATETDHAKSQRLPTDYGFIEYIPNIIHTHSPVKNYFRECPPVSQSDIFGSPNGGVK